jgi:hypothetical protein
MRTGTPCVEWRAFVCFFGEGIGIRIDRFL